MAPTNLIDKFIYGCSHDLKSPLTSIQGLVRIADYYPHNGDIHKCLEMIEDCTTKLDTLIRKLQEYMTDSHHPIKAQQVDANELIGKIRSEYKNQLDTYGISLLQEVRNASDWVTDSEVVSKILKYLISNSLAYHDPEKDERKIIIRIELNDKGSTIEVGDNGLGIEEEQQEKIFDVFYRGCENSIGAGMGLFLVKSLVEKAGGSIKCQSSLGEGTNIRIYFPTMVRKENKIINDSLLLAGALVMD
jgi:signal transduction histidine kinase